MTNGIHTNPQKILIVEDELLVAISTQSLLRSLDYEVTGIADTGKDAVRLAQTTSPDLILMDLRLRGPLDGIATAKEIQRSLSIPIVFVTGFGNEDVRRRGHAIGSFAYLSKPYSPEMLQGAICALLQDHVVLSSGT